MTVQPRWIPWRNDAATTCPAHGLLRQTGFATVNSSKVMTAVQPNSPDGRLIKFINSSLPVAPGKLGVCTADLPYYAAYDQAGGTPDANQISLGPAADSWTLHGTGGHGFAALMTGNGGRVLVNRQNVETSGLAPSCCAQCDPFISATGFQWFDCPACTRAPIKYGIVGAFDPNFCCPPALSDLGLYNYTANGCVWASCPFVCAGVTTSWVLTVGATRSTLIVDLGNGQQICYQKSGPWCCQSANLMRLCCGPFACPGLPKFICIYPIDNPDEQVCLDQPPPLTCDFDPPKAFPPVFYATINKVGTCPSTIYPLTLPLVWRADFFASTGRYTWRGDYNTFPGNPGNAIEVILEIACGFIVSITFWAILNGNPATLVIAMQPDDLHLDPLPDPYYFDFGNSGACHNGTNGGASMLEPCYKLCYNDPDYPNPPHGGIGSSDLNVVVSETP
jgi:hypothetical protein